jgi:hypothetical protein
MLTDIFFIKIELNLANIKHFACFLVFTPCQLNFE